MIAVLTAALLTIYSFAIAINVLRGRVHIDCGCTGPAAAGAEQPISYALVIRNFVLAGIALLAAIPENGRGLRLADYAVLGVTMVISVLLYSAASQLIRNGAAIRAWRTNRG